LPGARSPAKEAIVRDRERKVALVTGGAQGIGLEISRGLAARGVQVVLSDRNSDRGEEVAARLHAEGAPVLFCPLDVTNLEQIEQARRRLRRDFGRIDVLVNNAGINVDRTSVLAAPIEDLRRTLEVNAIGMLRVLQAFVPWMIERNYGRVVNLAAEAGSLERMTDARAPCYRVASAAAIAITRMVAAETATANVLVNCLCPGWTKTEMGLGDGSGGAPTRTVTEAADTALWLATLPDDGPRGGFFRDRKPLPW
jgi:NAD(P)-dependent dehydrogenase (short-subunit alcohol dehydrogenase family)